MADKEVWRQHKRDIVSRLNPEDIFGCVEKQRPGKEPWTTGLCPFHDDTNASFAYNRNTLQWKCFAGCGKGNAIDFVIQMTGRPFKEVIRELGEKVGVPFPGGKSQGEIEATYDYQDETGTLLFQVVRFKPKKFRQRRPDGNGDWIWNLKEVRRVPYRLPEVLKAKDVVIVEGEKDVESLRKLGLTATCCPQGAGKWRKAFNEHFDGKHILIIPDNDAPGRNHAEDVARNLSGIAATIKVVELPGLPEKGDVSDWISMGGTADALIELVAEAPEWAPSADLQTGRAGVLSDTDLANVVLLVERHGEDMKYAPERGWFVWDGTRWVVDEAFAMMRAKDTARQLIGRATKEWVEKSQRAERLRAMLFLARSEPGIASHYCDFDANTSLLNVRNGTIDIKTGELREHCRDDLCSKIVDVHYDPDASCEEWLTFLNRVMDGNKELIGYLQRAVGYTLTGNTGAQCLFFLHGSGANGKSVFLETVKYLLGEYGLSTPMDTFTVHQRSSIPNDVARMAGARFVAVSETADGQRLNEPLVKDLTGGDTIAARFLHKEFFDFRPQFKLWIRGNHKPQIRGSDEGIWRRLHLIPFCVRIPESERDPNLLERLKAELPGILAWAVKGCLEWQREGLKPPKEVQAAVSEYRTEMDVIGAFLAECCVEMEHCRVAARDIYRAYAEWCKSGGEHPVNQRRFGLALTERGFEKDKTREGIVYRGIGLTTATNEGEAF